MCRRCGWCGGWRSEGADCAKGATSAVAGVGRGPALPQVRLVPWQAPRGDRLCLACGWCRGGG